MTERFKDIEVSADTGEVRLYTNDTDYEEYTSEQLLELINTIYDLVNNQNEQMQELEEENKRMISKLNDLALELLDYGVVTMGKAVEISEMSNHDFRQYINKNKEG